MTRSKGTTIDRAQLGELLKGCATVLDAPRAMLAWTERGQRGLQMTAWTGTEVTSWQQQASDAFSKLVAQPLVDADFSCSDVAAPMPAVVWLSDGKLHRWQGKPVSARLRERYAMHGVISICMSGGLLHGRLFLLDIPRITSDKLMLGAIVGRQLHWLVEDGSMARRLATAAAADERCRLSHELHDGVLQSLVSIGLQLEAARSRLAQGAESVEVLLRELQDVVLMEHRKLRFKVRELQELRRSRLVRDRDLVDMTTALARDIERQWKLPIKVAPLVPGRFSTLIRADLAGEIYYMLREALVNAARHARATTASVSLGIDAAAIWIVVADDGGGFPFFGRYDLSHLSRLGLGPRVLSKRVTALGGTLTIDSSPSGAHLDIRIPVVPTSKVDHAS
jgi:signal transduction histidine kinase